MGATPFHHPILEVRLPKHFDKPTDMRYDGTQDPQEHLMAFEARMNLEGVGDVVRFSDISRAFLAQFTTQIAKAKHPINLLEVTQRPGESTRKYLDWFNDACLEIDGLTDSVASLCLTNRLLNEDFRKHLTTKPHSGRKRQKERARDGGPGKTSGPFTRVGKFTNYTPLTVPIVEDYQQIAEKGILSKPRPLKDRNGGNKSLYCDYHKGYGHKTQDCFDLKDVLEQAIWDEKLAEFSHLIREPRRRERDRDREDKSRTVKRRQEPKDNERGLTIVNVVIGRDATPRSKSAHKKDAKVLTVSSSSPTPSSKRTPPISFSPDD
ncbi:uncharacterized protein [Arachis hypogaea]|uniref:uncharacterized protein n=1 Tax=Arachis hypogaea TaxID=3818 RepID=UPI000DEC4764|nr:uncharacterized protein LOC112805776 [Arachis hypogaea]